MRRALFALVLCVLLQAAAPPVVSGQARAQPVATSYSTEQGLSHRAVYALGLDRRGFLWAGTGDGLNRFDGSAFKPFQPNPTDSTALSDLFVGVLLAHGDALWVGTGRSGLQQLDLRSERFRRFRAVTTAPQGSDFDRIASLALAPGGLYVGTVGGLFRFDTRQGRFSRLFGPGDPRGTLPVPRVQALLSEPDGTLWMGAPDGLYRYDAAGDTLRQIRGVPERIVTLAQAPDGAVLVGTGRGLYRQTSPADAFTRLPGVAGVVHSLAGEQDGTLWIGTNGGLMRWLPGERRPQQVNEDDTRALLFDARGQLWAATQGRGLVRIQISGALFRVWESQRAFQGLSVDAAGTLWAASNVGVVRITPGRTLTPLPGNAGGFSGITGGPAGTRYLSQVVGGVLRYDLQRGRWDSLRAAGLPRRYSANRVLRDRHGVLWIATLDDGLLRVDLTRGKARRFAPDTTGAFPHVYALPLLETRDGTLWVGTMGGGLARYDPVREAFTVYRHRTHDPNSLPSDRVVALHEADDGMLWVGTMGGGVARFDRRTGRFLRFGRRDGLPENHAYALVSDATGHIWIAASGALSRLDPRTRRVISYSRRDGLPDKGFRWDAAARTPDGTLYFGTAAGLVAFRPDHLPPLPSLPVVLTDVRLFNRPAHLGLPAHALERITLDHDQNFVSFGFAALDLDVPEAHTYQYRLDGLDSGWVDAGVRRLADYPNLAHGHYTFRVRAARYGSNIFGSETSVGVVVHPPWWETWWFRTLAMLLMVGAVYAAHRVRLENLLRVERTRRRIADDLHDDLGTKLATLATQLELSGEYGPPEGAPNALKRFSEDTRVLVGDLRDTVWVIDGQRDTLASLTDRIETAAFNLLGPDRCRVERPPVLPDVALPMEQRRHVYLLLKEALHNAHRHAQGAPVRFSVTATPDQAVFVVADTGPGFDASTLRGRGQGLGSLARRARAAGVHLELQSAPGAGTSVHVALPLKPTRWPGRVTR